jgi:uncharacterized protein (TIGR02266 family)
MTQVAAPSILALRCTLDYPDLDTFILRYGRNVSRRGVFLPAREPPVVGTAVRFEIVLSDGRLILRGEGVVVGRATLDTAQPERPHGMAVRFLRLDAESRAVLDKVESYKAANLDAFYEASPDLVDKPLEVPSPSSAAAHAGHEPAATQAAAAAPVPPAAPGLAAPAQPRREIVASANANDAVKGPEEAELLALRAAPLLPPPPPPAEAARRLAAILAAPR